MSDLSPEARRLLAEASDADDPTPSDEARIARALAVPLGIAALAPTVAQATTVAAAGTAATFKTVAVVVAVLAVGAGTLTVRASRHHTAETRHATPTARAPHSPSVQSPRSNLPTPIVPSPVAAPVAPAAPVAAPTVAPEERPRAGRSPRVEAPTEDSLRAESELLGDAHRAVGSGDAARALSLLDVYRARFPHGVMREEHDVEAVLALCALGREHDARVAGQRFLRAHPHSPLAPRVLQSCARTISTDDR